MSSKREKMIELLGRDLKNCYYPTACFVYPDIPQDKFDGAKAAYARGAEYGETLGMTDETVFGGGKRGLLFTETGLYSDDSSGRLITYQNAANMNIPEGGYKEEPLRELFRNLAAIDGVSSSNSSIGGFLGALLDGVSEILDNKSGTANGSKFCQKCGAQMAHDAAFCPKCGTRS